MLYTFYTELSVEKCLNIIDHQYSMDPFARDGIHGRVDFNNETFSIHKNRKNFRNSFARRFYGSLAENGDGTILRGNFRLHGGTMVFMAVWFSLALYALGNSIFSYTDGIHSSAGITGLLYPGIMIVFGVVLVLVGIRLSKKEEHFILQVLINRLKLHDVTDKNRI